MSVDLHNILAAMKEYQRLVDATPDGVFAMSPEHQQIKKQFAEIGFRIGVDAYGNVALYLMELAHPNAFGTM